MVPYVKSRLYLYQFRRYIPAYKKSAERGAAMGAVLSQGPIEKGPWKFYWTKQEPYA